MRTVLNRTFGNAGRQVLVPEASIPPRSPGVNMRGAQAPLHLRIWRLWVYPRPSRPDRFVAPVPNRPDRFLSDQNFWLGS